MSERERPDLDRVRETLKEEEREIEDATPAEEASPDEDASPDEGDEPGDDG